MAADPSPDAASLLTDEDLADLSECERIMANSTGTMTHEEVVRGLGLDDADGL